MKTVDDFVSWGNTLCDLAKIKEDEVLFKEAIDKYTEATKREPDNPWPFVCWGDALYDLAKIKEDEVLFKEAIDKYTEATKEDQNYSYAFIKRGTALTNLAEIKQDKNLYEEATKSFKEVRKSILDIFVYLDKEDIEQVIKTRVLHQLLDLDTDDGNFFKEATKNISQEKLDGYKEIYILSIFIISQLCLNNEYEKSVAYYTTKTVSQDILFNKSKFRLNAINNSNDPTEGKILLDYLSQSSNEDSSKEEFDTEYKTFAGCFTFNHDSLNQFRLYGKDGNQEGTGLSLVFCQNFFSIKPKMPTKKDDKKTGNSLETFFLNDEDKKYTLFRCVYIDPVTQRVDTVGHKEKYLFYREESKKAAKKKYETYRKYIDCVICIVDKKMEELRDLIQNKGLDQNVIGRLLINLRYLTKHIAFKEEQECRVVRICNFNDKKNKINIGDGSKMYIEYEPEILYSKSAYSIEKVYFGPKATDMKLFKDILKIKDLDKIPCKKSKNPLA